MDVTKLSAVKNFKSLVARPPAPAVDYPPRKNIAYVWCVCMVCCPGMKLFLFSLRVSSFHGTGDGCSARPGMWPERDGIRSMHAYYK